MHQNKFTKKVSLKNKIKVALNYLIETKQNDIEALKENLKAEELETKRDELKIKEPYYTSLETHNSNLLNYEQSLSICEQNLKVNQQSISYLQHQQEEIRKENIDLELKNLSKLDGWQFEKYCATLFRKLGYSVQITKCSGDFGADLILNNSISVQCKLYSNPVGLHALQEVFSSMARYKTKSAWVITNSTFTKQATEYAKDANIKLIDNKELEALISRVSASNQNSNLTLANKITTLRSECEVLNENIKDLRTKICEEKEEIDKIEVKLCDLLAVKILIKQYQDKKEQTGLKIEAILKEIHQIKSELSLLNKFGFFVKRKLAKKYNLL